MTNIKRNAKAYIAGTIAGLTALGTALDDNAITYAEAVGVAVATLTAFYAVWRVPNKRDDTKS